MNTQQILHALDATDENLLQEIDTIRCAHEKKPRTGYKWLWIAACLCVSCISVWGLANSNQRDTPLIETQILSPSIQTHNTELSLVPTIPTDSKDSDMHPEAVLYWEPYYNDVDMVIADGALRQDVFLFGEDLNTTELESMTPENMPQWMTLSGYGLFLRDGTLNRIHLSATTSMVDTPVNITIGEEKPFSCYILPEKAEASYCRGVEVMLSRYTAPDGSVELFAETEINDCFFAFSMHCTEDALIENELDFASVIQVFAESHIGLDALSSVHADHIPEMFDRKLSHEEALDLETYGSYFLSQTPIGFAQESIHHHKSQNEEYLSGLWTKGLDELYWEVSVLTEKDRARLTHAKETDRYDLSLYPIPRADSVPEELREVVDNPIFYAEELTPELVWAKAYKFDEQSDSSGWRMSFSVLYGDVIIKVRSKGIDPDWIYEQLVSFFS